jgi:O-Methyltransferase involved in polyketide biosynthesis
LLTEAAQDYHCPRGNAYAEALREVAALAPGSTLAMTFLLPLELADPEVRPGLEMAEKGARASGTPFLSFFAPPDILALANEAGFKEARHVSAADLTQRYFMGRSDGLRPPNNAEELLLANTQVKPGSTCHPRLHYAGR